MTTLNMTVNFEDPTDGRGDRLTADHVARDMVTTYDHSATLVDATWLDDHPDPQPPYDHPDLEDPDDDKDQDPAQPDREIEAIAACVRVLLPLDPCQSAGVARYIADRFTIGDLRS